MTVGDFLKNSETRLKKSGIGTARLDCLVLLEDATGKDRAWLLAHPEFVFQGRSLETVMERVERRSRHEPLAYIRGKTEFYGREFIVDKRVLEPRPESETMIDLLKQQLDRLQNTHDAELCIADIGTGSGALAVTAKLEIPDANVVATDIDPGCLVVAKKNAIKYGVEISWHRGYLLAPLLSAVNSGVLAILANLPYVPNNYELNEAARFEPAQAIFGGEDGLDFYRELFDQTSELLQKPKYVLTESLPFRHAELTRIADMAGYHQTAEDDFIQVFERA